MRQWLKQASDLNRIAENTEPSAIKQAFREINGLNLFLEDKKARLSPRSQSHFPPENIWLALRATKEKAAHAGDNFPENTFLVRFYETARTHFSTKCWSPAACSSKAGTRPTGKTLCIFEISPRRISFLAEKGLAGGSLTTKVVEAARLQSA